MASHSSTPAWKIPWMEEPGRLQSMGLHRVGHNWRDLAAAGICTVSTLEVISSVGRSVMSDSLWPHGLSTPGFPVHHQLPELAQTDVHWVSAAIQPSHSLSSASLPAFNLSSFPVSQFFISGGQSIGPSASVLPMNIQDWFPLGLTGLISFLPKGLSRVLNLYIKPGINSFNNLNTPQNIWNDE